jgi:hypothetical protein
MWCLHVFVWSIQLNLVSGWKLDDNPLRASVYLKDTETANKEPINGGL